MTFTPHFIAVFASLSLSLSAQTIDTVVFGSSESEKAHGLSSEHSTTITGGLGEPARKILPLEEKTWSGGKIFFTLKVDPEKQNYLTVRFWGDDVTENRLLLFADGKQIGYRHLGDIEQLDFGSFEPACKGRFYYTTTPLPLEMTHGKSTLPIEIRGYGRIWGYGENFERYQRKMHQPSRGIYRAYTHTDGCFVPDPSEKQGAYPRDAPVRKSPGPEIMDTLKERVTREINGMLSSKQPLSQQQAQFLAKAWWVKWTPAYQNSSVPKLVTNAADDYFRSYLKDPKLATNDPKQYNPDWFGVGPLAHAVHLVGDAIAAQILDQQVDYGGTTLTRRQAWGDLFKASLDHLRGHRPHYTNQTMIQDYNIYLINRGLATIAPSRALPEADARRFLYEAIAIEPWRGNYTEKGPDFRLGQDYWQLTAKGLTKELGYVGNYGEVLDWVTHIYLATGQPGKPRTGDRKIAERLVKMEHARAPFRYPSFDAEGNRAMRMQTIIGWRDSHFPGDICYAERTAWEGSALYSVAAILDPASVGAARQMMDDNQFYASVGELVKMPGLRVTTTLLRIPDDYQTVKAAPATDKKLPMTWEQPDFVFSDEEDGVVALKNEGEILYVSLYWRARYGINYLARVHHLKPDYERIGVVRQDTKFTPQEANYVRGNWTNMGFGDGGHRYPDEAQSAHTGEILPIAKIPESVKFKPGDENTYAGKGDFYTLRYGSYLIFMNCSADKTFETKVPSDVKSAVNLVDRGAPLSPGTTGQLAPRTTAVLFLNP